MYVTVIFCFKQKTAYEMRISDWSSDVCSSDLVDRYGTGAVSAHGVRRRLDQADRLSRAVGLDMVDVGWRPTVDNYLGSVTKPRILEAVREATGEQSAQLIDRKSVEEGTSVSVRVDLGGRRIIKKKNNTSDANN